MCFRCTAVRPSGFTAEKYFDEFIVLKVSASEKGGINLMFSSQEPLYFPGSRVRHVDHSRGEFPTKFLCYIVGFGEDLSPKGDGLVRRWTK
jgi:hypothetical protein